MRRGKFQSSDAPTLNFPDTIVVHIFTHEEQLRDHSGN